MTTLMIEILKYLSYVDSNRDAMFTVSPNKQYLGLVVPTIPLTTGPN